MITDSQQRGIVLISSLIMLLIISLVGIAAGKQAMMGRRDAINGYDRLRSFSAADSALRAAESALAAAAGDETALESLTIAQQADNWWQRHSNWNGANTLSEFSQPPAYQIELREFVPINLEAGQPHGRSLYRVTATADGPGGARAYVQSHYALLQ